MTRLLFLSAARRGALERLLATSSGLAVEVRVAPSPLAAVEAFGRGADAGLLNVFEYLLARAEYDVEARLQALRADGAASDHGEILVRDDGPLRALGDLTDRRVAYVAPHATSGFVFPAMLLAGAGVRAVPRFARTHADALALLRARDVDAVATHATAVATEPNVRVIASTDGIPNEPVCFRRGLLPRTAARLEAALRQLAGSPEGRALLSDVAGVTGFRTITDRDYRSVLSAVRAAGQTVYALVPGGSRVESAARGIDYHCGSVFGASRPNIHWANHAGQGRDAAVRGVTRLLFLSATGAQRHSPRRRRSPVMPAKSRRPSPEPSPPVARDARAALAAPAAAAPTPLAPAARIGLEDAQQAFLRTRAEIDAVDPDALAPLNVDVLSACFVAVGAAPAIARHRDALLRLPDFQPRWVDSLGTYARAAWLAQLASVHPADAPDFSGQLAEVSTLRGKLLVWATPLVAAGLFDPDVVAQIREGSGAKDSANDLVALVLLFRKHWDAVRTMCGVTEDDLVRGLELGTAVFAALGARDNPASAPSVSEATLVARKAWTLLDRAYGQCRRGILYLRHDAGDADEIAPSLRRNNGPRPQAEKQPAHPVAPVPPAPPAGPVAPVGNPVGNDTPPVIRR